MDLVILLQLVDSVMSPLQHPTAWDLRARGRRRILQKLEPLLCAVAHNTAIVERVLRCLTHVLQQQEWCCVQDGANIFVSAVNPEQWQSYLSMGKCTDAKVFWPLLAYFAQPRMKVKTKESCRGQLVLWMLTNGLLWIDSTSNISSKHRATTYARTDIVNLTIWILSASLGSLPHRDKLLFDLLQRTLNLLSTTFITMKTLGLSSTPQLKMRKPTGDLHTKCLCSIDEWQLLLASVDQSLTLPVPLGD